MTHYDRHSTLTETEEQAELEASRAEARAGKVVLWAEVKQWMESWDTEHELPVPTPRGANSEPSP